MTEQPSGSAADRQALLEALLQEEGFDAAPAAATIPPHQTDGDLPLSFSQERIWVLDQIEPGNPAYNIPAAIRLHGAVNLDALRAALSTIIGRHESLRTTYKAIEGRPYQVINELAALPFTVHDLTGLDDTAREAEAERLVHDEAALSFDIAEDLPIRVTVLQLGPHEHILTVTMHHIASDGWSFNVFAKELGTLYEANLAGGGDPLDELPIQYADYAVWQADGGADEKLSQQLEYWRNQLGGDIAKLDLPTDYARPSVRSFRGDRITRPLPAAVVDGLRPLVRSEGVTNFMVLLAALKVLLHRYSGQDDIVIGSPIAGRTRPEVKNLVGLFLNTLVLRTDVSGNPSFRQLLDRVRKTSLDAFDNQDLPFERILEELRVERDLSQTPLFQVFFNMLNFEDKPLPMAGIESEFISSPDMNSRFDLTFYLRPTSDGLDLTVLYNADLFSPVRMASLLDQYELVLKQAVAEPDLAIDRFELVTGSARSVLPDPTEPLDNTWFGAVHQAVDAHASRTPEAVAVRDHLDTWSYLDLSTRSNQLADLLITQGVVKGDVVAVYGERSASLVWAVLGVHKAGAAVMMLDPGDPSLRTAEHLRSIEPRGFISLSAVDDPVIGELLVELDIGATVELPRLAGANAAPDLATASTDPAAVTVEPDDVAFVAFTSGSTGTPKAVLGRHGPLSHFIPWLAERFSLTSEDRFSMLSALMHDPLQRDVFTPLFLGGTICVPDPDGIGAPGWLSTWLRNEGVTVANLTPAMGQVLIESSDVSEDGQRVDSLRYAFFVGDALRRKDVAGLTELCPKVTVVNLYGSTESQRALSYHVVEPDSAVAEDLHPAIQRKPIVPLGTGMSGAQLVLQSAGGMQAGVGELAEIGIRSPHLALGYRNDAAATAERFIGNPFVSEPAPEDRIYRTGDMGRYLPDGSVEFADRGDLQVQVRGFRVELAEIDAVWSEHEAVKQAVTVASGTAAGETTRLWSFIVARPGTDPEPTGLLDHLRARVPAHMVPADVLLLDDMPMTSSGKIDRRALVPPSGQSARTPTDVGPPRNETESLLVDIWQEVLEVSPVGIEDNFFDLGGHSLAAVRAFARLERETGLRLPLTILFEAPTIAQLATAISDQGWESDWTSLVPIKTTGTRRPLFYVSPFQISVLSLSKLGQYLDEDQPLYGLQPQGIDGDNPDEQSMAQPAHQSLEEIAADYIEEMRLIQPDGPYRLGGHCAGSWVAFEMAQQLQAENEQIDSLLLVDSRPPNFQPPKVSATRYVARRLSMYWQSGRLRDAVTWKLRLFRQRMLTRKFGRENLKRQAVVRQAHYEAHQEYRSGTFDGDAVLIRSHEATVLKDKDWHLRWAELISGDMEQVVVPGTHAELLFEPNVRVLAAEVTRALDPSPDSSDEPSNGR